MELALTEFEQHLHLAKDYLEARGITAATARTFRLGVVRGTYRPHLAGRLVIPYLSPAGVTNLKFRTIAGEKHYCYTDAGIETGLFNAQALLRRSSRYVVTEGEMDAISVEQAGFPCVGYPGVNNWKPHFTRCFYGCAEVIVLADGDDAGRNAAKTVAKAIGSVADAVHVVDLPDGADANSILATRGVEGLQELLA